MSISKREAAQLRRAITKAIGAAINWHEAQSTPQHFEHLLIERHAHNTRLQLDQLITRFTDAPAEKRPKR